MKYFSLIIIVTFLIACGHVQEGRVTALESKMNSLLEEKRAIETVNRLFVSTDNRDWESVKACFADEVVLDMDNRGERIMGKYSWSSLIF